MLLSTARQLCRNSAKLKDSTTYDNTRVDLALLGIEADFLEAVPGVLRVSGTVACGTTTTISFTGSNFPGFNFDRTQLFVFYGTDGVPKPLRNEEYNRLLTVQAATAGTGSPTRIGFNTGQLGGSAAMMDTAPGTSTYLLVFWDKIAQSFNGTAAGTDTSGTSTTMIIPDRLAYTVYDEGAAYHMTLADGEEQVNALRLASYERHKQMCKGRLEPNKGGMSPDPAALL